MARDRKETRLIVVHCSATRARQNIGIRTIHQWHTQAGIFSDRGLSGYNAVIRRSGKIELGREPNEIGAHALGFNEVSYGICLVGGARKAKEGEQPDWDDMVADDNFTSYQKEALAELLTVLDRIYTKAHTIPHSLISNKACPSFDVFLFLQQHFGGRRELREMKAREAIEEYIGSKEAAVWES